MKFFALGAALVLSLSPAVLQQRGAKTPQRVENKAPQRAESKAPEQVANPESELLVLWSAGRDALLVDGRDAGLAAALGMLDTRLAELAQDVEDPAFPADTVRLVHELFTGPACLRVERVAASPGEFPVRIQLSCRARDAETARRNVELVGALAARAGVPLERFGGGAPTLGVLTPIGPLVITAQADALVLALGEPRQETFACATGLPADAAPAMHARWNGRGVGELIAPFVLANGPDAQRAWRLLEVLGVVGASAPTRTWSLGIAAERALVRTVVSGWAAAGDGTMALPPLDAADFARIPADATCARLFQVRPRTLLALAESLEPDAGQDTGAALRSMLGADLEELLGLFGPTAGAFASLSTGGGGLASGVAFIETVDAEQVEALLARLAALVETAAAGPARGRIAVRTSERGGARVRTLVFPGLPVPLELSLAVHADALWIALRPDVLEAALAAQASGRSVLDHPRLEPLAVERPADAVSFGFFDAPPCLERGYGTASTLAAALANALRSPYDPAREPGSILPPFGALHAGARASVSWSRLVGDDLVGTTCFDRSFVANTTVALGAPISGLYSSVAGLGIISSIAIPKLMSARLAANESAAIATLRSLTSAQAQLAASAAIDEDKDGVGEYGFLGELAGARTLRGRRERLDPPVLPSSFALLEDDGDGDGVVQRSGYWFQVWLPLRAGSAIAERVNPGTTAKVHPDAAERAWCAYAWPVEPGATGQRAFFVNQEGELMAFDNAGGFFGGLQGTGGRQPAFDSALTRPDLEAAPTRGKRSSDGTQWRLLE